MDQTKKIVSKILLTSALLTTGWPAMQAQDIESLKFCDRKYSYEIGQDSITLFFNLFDKYGNRIQDTTPELLQSYMVVKEDGNLIPGSRFEFSAVNTGERIPSDYTFSVLVDLSIPPEGKEQIYSAVGKLINSAADSCVYISFFGNDVTPTEIADKNSYSNLKEKFLNQSDSKLFYSALYAKLLEFNPTTSTPWKEHIRKSEEYADEPEISRRAALNKDKNILIVFTEGTRRPDDEAITFAEVVDYQEQPSHLVPRVMALYYTEEGENLDIEYTLKGICSPRDSIGNPLPERSGKYLPSSNVSQILKNFEEVVNDAAYDYAFTYKVAESEVYSRKVSYTAEWKGIEIGSGEYSIGTAERPWPVRAEDSKSLALKLLYALLVTILTIAFFFAIIKILVPFIRSKSFALKYYKKYQAEANVQRRICHYCKQEIQPGQIVVRKCKHIMHVHCWKQNGYKCAEYGQNCKTGIQSHIEWKELFTKSSLKDCYQAFSGIVAGFVSWIIYELGGRGIFDSAATAIVGMFISEDKLQSGLIQDCINKTSAFLTIGLLLGLLLSLIFRYNDEYRNKSWKIWLKITGLSLLTALIGMVSFAIGANIMCLILSITGNTYIPWYCSLPGYLIFSICVSLALTIKSTIPVKSALIGGLCSSIIGFIVLYCSGEIGNSAGWMHMLLDFIIYGGGLGASLVTVRMLAEKYFLVIQNGVRAGQRIPIHKWMNATGGGNKVSIGMTGECEIQMNWEKSNKVAKEHAQLFIDHEKQLPMLKPLANGVVFNTRAELPVGRPAVLSNGDTFKIGDTIFLYTETE